MSDIIGQAMGILGGGKKKDAPVSARTPATAPARTGAPTRTHAPATLSETTAQANIHEMLDIAERRVKSELARYGLLHARLLEARELLKAGSDKNLVEGRVKFALNEAKVTLK